MFKSDGSFEVNAIDLIALEALRVYEPSLYQALSENKKLLTAVKDLGSSRRDGDRTKVTGLLNTVASDRVEGVREVIQQLFPPVQWAFGGSTYTPEWSETWYRDLRVCSEKAFDRYFQLALASGDLSQATLQRLLDRTNEREALGEELNALARKGQLEVAMDRLSIYRDQIPIDHAVPFLAAIFDVGDQLSNQEPGMLSLSPAMKVQVFIVRYLRREADTTRRGEIIRSVFEQTEGLKLPVTFVNLIGAPQGENTPHEEFVTAAVLERLKNICVLKITSFLNSGGISENLSLLFSWRAWAGPEAPAAYCEAQINSTDGLLRFLRTFLLVARSAGISDRVDTSHWYMRSGDIDLFVPFESVQSKVNDLPADAVLSAEDERAVSAFKKAAERRRTGRTDEGPHALD